MDGDVDVESFWSGLLWGIVLVVTLVRFEVWLRRPPTPVPVDPFEALRWDVHREVRDIIEGEVVNAAG